MRVPAIDAVNDNDTCMRLQMPDGPGCWWQVDVSAGSVSGPAGTRFMLDQCRALPPLRPLLLVLKAFLKSQGLGDASAGGLSSFCLTQLVRAPR